MYWYVIWTVQTVSYCVEAIKYAGCGFLCGSIEEALRRKSGCFLIQTRDLIHRQGFHRLLEQHGIKISMDGREVTETTCLSRVMAHS